MIGRLLLAFTILSTFRPRVGWADWAANEHAYASGLLNDFTNRFEWDLVDPNARR